MKFLQKKIWIAWSKFRFLGLPIEKRVRLEVEQDGRHLTFLLAALGEAGYGVQVVNSPWVFRELICLRKSVPMPFVIGGKERECGMAVTDREEFSFQGSVFSQDSGEHSPLTTRHPPHILLDYDYFSGLNTDGFSHGGTANTARGRQFHHETHQIPRNEEAGLRPDARAGAAFSNPSTSELARDFESTSLTRDASGPASTPATSNPPLATAPEALRMPYFMHPSVYHKGLHRGISIPDQALQVTRHSAASASTSHPQPATSYPPQRLRRFRIGFFGTHDREFYTKHYDFPGMNRFEILEVFLKRFGDRMAQVSGAPEQWLDSEIVVAIDKKGGDRTGKSFLSQEHYFAALRECDFVLSPPGWCMPVSHNLIEAMFCGASPITNAGVFMSEPLADNVNCLAFEDERGLVSVIERALAMDERAVERMRREVLDFYEKILDPKGFLESVIRANAGKILVNAEEKSVPLLFPGKL